MPGGGALYGGLLCQPRAYPAASPPGSEYEGGYQDHLLQHPLVGSVPVDVCPVHHPRDVELGDELLFPV